MWRARLNGGPIEIGLIAGILAMAATTDTQTDTPLGHDSPLGLVLDLNSDLEFGRIYVSEKRLSGLGWPRMQKKSKSELPSSNGIPPIGWAKTEPSTFPFCAGWPSPWHPSLATVQLKETCLPKKWVEAAK
jgi:hypothetical protein